MTKSAGFRVKPGMTKTAICEVLSIATQPRKPESSHIKGFWTPASAGVRGLGLFTKQSISNFKTRNNNHESTKEWKHKKIHFDFVFS
jgi:hypothetical protein